MKTIFNLNRAAVLLAGLCVAMSAGVGNAGVINPAFDTFGSLPAATFGGSGIPNNAVAIRTITDGSTTITLGLTATSRYDATTVTNDGNGTFSVDSGSFVSPTNASPANPNLARWNFNYFVNVTNGNLGDYDFKLLYDFDSATDTDETDLGEANLRTSYGGAKTPPLQDSVNLGFSSLNGGFFGNLFNPDYTATPPAGFSFDPTPNGEYTFALIASKAGGELGSTSIVVNAVPEPATLAMFAMLTVGAAGAYRRRKNRVAAAC